jgi:hypothetical protein
MAKPASSKSAISAIPCFSLSPDPTLRISGLVPISYKFDRITLVAPLQARCAALRKNPPD